MSLNKRERISTNSLPEKQKQRIEGALRGDWPSTVEIIKRNDWYAHFVLKTLEIPDEPETIISIDKGEHTLTTAVTITRSNPEKPMNGNGAAKRSSASAVYIAILEGSSRISTVLERLSTERRRERERRKVNQQLHIIANQIIEYAKQFPKPVIVMENLG